MRKPTAAKPVLIGNDVMQYQQYIKHLTDFSRHMGIGNTVPQGYLRRGGAYIFALHGSTKERCARMEHSNKDASYWSHYHNTTPALDFQALRSGLDQESMTSMSSTFLATAAHPRDSVSEESIRKVQDEELVELLRNSGELAWLGD